MKAHFLKLFILIKSFPIFQHNAIINPLNIGGPMKYLFVLILSLSFVFASFAQTDEEIRREAYPDDPVVGELTAFQILWKNLIEARKNSDVRMYEILSEQLRNEFLEKFEGYKMPTPLNFATREEIEAFNANNLTEAEMQLYAGSVATFGTTTQSGGNPRTVRIRTAADGTQFLAFGPATRDTLYIFRSTDAGANWTLLTAVSSAGSLGRGFDFYIADTTGGYRLGVVLSTETATDLGVLSFLSFRPDNPFPLIANTFAIPDAGRGFIHPVIVSDGYYYEPASTYWYVAYQDYSTSTPTSNPVRAALTTDWGQTWVFTLVRSTFNDYDVSIEVGSYAAEDTVFVVLSNNLTVSNPNLRIRKVALSNFTGTFSQFNPATTSDPEFHGLLKVDRTTGEMICTFTRTTGGINNVAYVFSRPAGPYFVPTAPTFVAQSAYNEGGLDVHCVEGQTSIWRFAYLASGAVDTVVYKWSLDLATGVDGHIAVNTVNPSNQIFPTVSGHIIDLVEMGNNDGSGFAYSGTGNSGIYYNRIADTTIPVELAAFTANVTGRKVQLNWQTASETNNRGFEVQRNDGSAFVAIAFVDGKGTTSQTQNYSFTDNELAAGSYTYRLKQMDFDGTFTYSNTVEVIIGVPQEYALNQNYPNPFNPSTRIAYTIPVASNVNLELYTVTGSKITTLVNTNQEAGYYSIDLDADVLNLSTGVYFYRFSAVDNTTGKQFIETKKMLYMK